MSLCHLHGDQVTVLALTFDLAYLQLLQRMEGLLLSACNAAFQRNDL